MARTAKQPEPFDRAVSLILRAAAEGRRVTHRQLAEGAGLGLNLVGIILRGAPPPATVGEAAKLAAFLGMSASELFAQAERLADLLAAGVAAGFVVQHFDDTGAPIGAPPDVLPAGSPASPRAGFAEPNGA